MSHSLPIGSPVELSGQTVLPTDRQLSGERVVLRRVVAEDVAPLYQSSHGSDEIESLWTYMGYGPFESETEMKAWLVDCAASTDPLFRVVIDRATNQPVGMVSYLNIVPDARRLELGHIWYAPAVQRTRVNTETIYLMLCESFNQLGYRRVEWKCDALNVKSRAAAIRLGFSFEGLFRQHLIYKGRNRDTAWFSMLDSEWPRIKANMETWLYESDGSLSLSELNDEE